MVRRLPDSLSDEDLAQVLALLPKDVGDSGLRSYVVDEIEFARTEFQQIVDSAPQTWDYAKVRKAAAEELERLEKAANEVAAAYLALSDLAEARIVGHTRFPTPASVFPELDWLDPTEDSRQRHEFLERLASLSMWTASSAAEARRSLEEMGPGKMGRPKDLAGLHLALKLWSVWKYLGGEVAPSNRGDIERWPFQEFVEAVGKTVDPDFTGQAAAKRVRDLNASAARIIRRKPEGRK